ncbi:hypothetical protein Tco_0089363 [Tanacetum coccineum]
MHFLLSSMSVVYVLTTPIPEDGENTTVEQIRKRAKWDNYDYVYRGLILNGMSNPLFYIYQNVESSKELWDSLEAKYMAEDASSKKFTQHKINMGEAIQVSCTIDKLPPSWKDSKHTLKPKKEELTLVELGSHLRIKESLGVQDSDKPKGNNVYGPSVVNICGKPGHLKKDCKGGKFSNRANGSGTNGLVDSSTNSLKDLKFSSGKIVSLFNVLRVPDIRKILVSSSILNNCGYKQVIESNKFVLPKHDVFIRDAIFDENRFSSVPKPSQRSMINGTEDIGGLVVPENVIEEVVT